MSAELSSPLPGNPLRTGIRPKYILFAALAVIYVYVMWNVEAFLFNAKDPEWAHIAPFKLILLPHGMAAAFALFLGPLQFSDRLRRKYMMLHRVTGYLYIIGCYVGAPLGIYIQWFEERAGESRNFTIASAADAIIWMTATTVALYFVRSGKVQQHRQWMTRSFFCAIIFLEVRAIMVAFQLPDAMAEIVVWSCVAAAFPIADLVLQAEELMKTRTRTLRAARG